MLSIETIVVSEFSQNCRLLLDSAHHKAILIDPGSEADKLQLELQRQGCELESIWLTHSHLDHCGAVADLLAASKARLFAHPGEKSLRQNVEQIASMYGIRDASMKNCPEPDVELLGGEVLEFGGVDFKTLFTPGHSPGHLCFYAPSLGILIGGDLVFSGSVGRTDFPGGDMETLLQSVREKILVLPDSTRILPGHGPDTTVGVERVSNPFFS